MATLIGVYSFLWQKTWKRLRSYRRTLTANESLLSMTRRVQRFLYWWIRSCWGAASRRIRRGYTDCHHPDTALREAFVHLFIWSNRGTEESRKKMASCQRCNIWGDSVEWSPLHRGSSRLGDCCGNRSKFIYGSRISESLQIIGTRQLIVSFEIS